MCAPVDLTSGTLTVALKGKNIYIIELEPKKLEAGKPYKFSGSPVSPTGSIEFADPNTKSICVQKWDKNGDGELSYEEAAAVTTIPKEGFRGRYFTSFDELRYFTNLKEIGYDAFLGCSYLTSIIIPNGVNSIKPGTFSGCRELTSITIPNGVTSIENKAFFFCI